MTDKAAAAPRRLTAAHQRPRTSSDTFFERQLEGLDPVLRRYAGVERPATSTSVVLDVCSGAAVWADVHSVTIIREHSWLCASLVRSDVRWSSERTSRPADIAILGAGVDVEVLAACQNFEVVRVRAVLQPGHVLLSKQCGEPRIFPISFLAPAPSWISAYI